MLASRLLPNLFWPSQASGLGASFWASSQPFLALPLGILWASEPLLSLFWGLFGLLWVSSKLLGLFPAFSGPLRVSSQPFLGLGPVLAGPRPSFGASRLLLGLFGPRGLFWAFCGFLSFFPAFSGCRAPFQGFSKLLDVFQPFLGLGACSGFQASSHFWGVAMLLWILDCFLSVYLRVFLCGFFWPHVLFPGLFVCFLASRSPADRQQ